ncbi:hypothetical protein JTE90_001075 [Oedothorax gibbosus]|uniref:Uncharacterized protein n=1 Tax=Oedothorax gibbosus TaxID=931172 RepID=A0AAV6TN25_9ARAC|nr:hypothetical protein JTE90_001075 [Oedothorax gibbosus]
MKKKSWKFGRKGEKELQGPKPSSSDTLQLMHDTFTDTLKQKQVPDKKNQTRLPARDVTELHNIVQRKVCLQDQTTENDGHEY